MVQQPHCTSSRTGLGFAAQTKAFERQAPHADDREHARPPLARRPFRQPAKTLSGSWPPPFACSSSVHPLGGGVRDYGSIPASSAVFTTGDKPSPHGLRKMAPRIYHACPSGAHEPSDVGAAISHQDGSEAGCISRNHTPSEGRGFRGSTSGSPCSGATGQRPMTCNRLILVVSAEGPSRFHDATLSRASSKSLLAASDISAVLTGRRVISPRSRA